MTPAQVLHSQKEIEMQPHYYAAIHIHANKSTYTNSWLDWPLR